jgi:hypothetical protein
LHLVGCIHNYITKHGIRKCLQCLALLKRSLYYCLYIKFLQYFLQKENTLSHGEKSVHRRYKARGEICNRYLFLKHRHSKVTYRSRLMPNSFFNINLYLREITLWLNCKTGPSTSDRTVKRTHAIRFLKIYYGMWLYTGVGLHVRCLLFLNNLK